MVLDNFKTVRVGYLYKYEGSNSYLLSVLLIYQRLSTYVLSKSNCPPVSQAQLSHVVSFDVCVGKKKTVLLLPWLQCF